MKRIYELKFTTYSQYDGNEEEEYEETLTMNVAGKDAEHAIERVKEEYVGKTSAWMDEEESPPVAHTSKISRVGIEGVKHLLDIDL